MNAQKITKGCIRRFRSGSEIGLKLNWAGQYSGDRNCQIMTWNCSKIAFRDERGGFSMGSGGERGEECYDWKEGRATIMHKCVVSGWHYHWWHELVRFRYMFNNIFAWGKWLSQIQSKCPRSTATQGKLYTRNVVHTVHLFLVLKKFKFAVRVEAGAIHCTQTTEENWYSLIEHLWKQIFPPDTCIWC